jgi:hypothetical protein
MDAYWTHVPALAKAFQETTGAVLELGAGDYSTYLLHELCTASGRSLVTLENNAEWLKKYKGLASPLHQLHLVEDWDSQQELDMEWGLVFVDHHPNAHRGIAIERLSKKAKVIVAHDAEDRELYGYPEAFALFNDVRMYKTLTPWTVTLRDRKKEAVGVSFPKGLGSSHWC